MSGKIKFFTIPPIRITAEEATSQPRTTKPEWMELSGNESGKIKFFTIPPNRITAEEATSQPRISKPEWMELSGNERENKIFHHPSQPHYGRGSYLSAQDFQARLEEIERK